MESIDDFCFCNLGSSSTLTRKRLVGVPEKRVEASAESHRSDGKWRMQHELNVGGGKACGLAAMVQGVISAAVVQGGLVAVTVVVVQRREHDL
ncbi:hypothetical protein YC2023_068127 [Brassica napus]